ncbi:hypothetical protein [Christiangramia fulva]|nr:hypothetical protein [Christiangramia fulva]
MRTKISNCYGWERPEIMHKYSVMWCSRLNFISKEQEFLTRMLKEKVFLIMDSDLTAKAEKLIEQLDHLKKEAISLLRQVNLHRNGLRILFDKVTHEEDWDYKHAHRKLMIKMHEFDSKNQALKKEIFRTITTAIKHQKQKRLSL